MFKGSGTVRMKAIPLLGARVNTWWEVMSKHVLNCSQPWKAFAPQSFFCFLAAPTVCSYSQARDQTFVTLVTPGP